MLFDRSMAVSPARCSDRQLYGCQFKVGIEPLTPIPKIVTCPVCRQHKVSSMPREDLPDGAEAVRASKEGP